MASKKTHNVGPATSTAEVSILSGSISYHKRLLTSKQTSEKIITRIKQILRFG